MSPLVMFGLLNLAAIAVVAGLLAFFVVLDRYAQQRARLRTIEQGGTWFLPEDLQ